MQHAQLPHYIYIYIEREREREWRGCGYSILYKNTSYSHQKTVWTTDVYVVALKRAVVSVKVLCTLSSLPFLTGAGVFCHSLGSLAHSVLGQFTGQEKTDSCLDFSAGDGGPFVVVSQTRGLGSDALKDIIDERVHDIHGLAGDSGVWVDLLQHLVDVDAVAFPPLPSAFLVAGAHGFCLGGSLLRTFGCRCFGWHGV